MLTADKNVAEYFESAITNGADPKSASNWIMTAVMRMLKDRNLGITESPVTAAMLAEMLKLVADGTISGKIAKTVFAEMEKTGKEPKVIVEEKGLVQIADEGAIEKFVDDAINANLRQVEQYKGGKASLLGFFVGQVMKASSGKANPAVVNKLIKQKLGQ